MNSADKKATITTPQIITNPQVNFMRKPFDDMVADKGYNAYIERALRCPCAEAATGQSRSDCVNCAGSGWFFIDKTQTVLACTSMASRNKYEPWTVANAGTVNITARPQDRLGYMDKITLNELETVYTQRRNLYSSAGGNWFGLLIYEPIEVYDVYLYKEPTQPLIYVNPDDYQITRNKITLSGAFIASNGISFPMLTVRYAHNPVYHIIDVNRDMIKQKDKPACNAPMQQPLTNYPINCVGRRAHYVFDALNADGTGTIDNTNYDRTPINYDY